MASGARRRRPRSWRPAAARPRRPPRRPKPTEAPKPAAAPSRAGQAGRARRPRRPPRPRAAAAAEAGRGRRPAAAAAATTAAAKPAEPTKPAAAAPAPTAAPKYRPAAPLAEDVVFWHTQTGPLAEGLNKIIDDYNAKTTAGEDRGPSTPAATPSSTRRRWPSIAGGGLPDLAVAYEIDDRRLHEGERGRRARRLRQRAAEPA